MIRIQDVAAEAGVSVSTVSRVLNNSFTVTEEKRAHVMEAVKRVGYQPIRAKTTKTSKNKLILMFSSIVIESIIEPMQNAAVESGYQLLFNYLGENNNIYERINEVLKLLQDNNIGGLILMNIIIKDEHLTDYMSRFPVVQIGEGVHSNPLYIVSSDDKQAGYDLTTHLLERGYDSIGFAGVNSQHGQPDYSRNRLEGYKEALEEHHIPLNSEMIFDADYSTEGGADAARYFTSLKKPLRAICCVSDIIAIGCIGEMKKLGKRVPHDVAVAGFDNMIVSQFCSPSLTTMAQSFEEIGVEAVNMLDQLIQGNLAKGRKLFIPHELIIRDST
jgi:LacI family repressor for deo operon, udp, cdd, tsx, nupC, and nupG